MIQSLFSGQPDDLFDDCVLEDDCPPEFVVEGSEANNKEGCVMGQCSCTWYDWHIFDAEKPGARDSSVEALKSSHNAKFPGCSLEPDII